MAEKNNKKVEEKGRAEGNEKQRAMVELKILVPQAKEVKAHLENVDSQIQDLLQTKKALMEIVDCKEGSPMLAQLATGMFVKAELKNVKNVVLNVGANTGVEKTIEEANKLVETQMEEIQQVRSHFIRQFEALRERITQLHTILE